MQQIRNVNSARKRLDLMLKHSKRVILDHGTGAYEFDHYDYDAPSLENRFTGRLDVYYKDTEQNKVILYMSLDNENLRKPMKHDAYRWFVDCNWDSKYPSLIHMREYEYRP